MAEQSTPRRPGLRAWVDFAALAARAFVSGLAAAVALGFAALVLAGNARAAAPVDVRAGTLLLRSGDPGGYIAAPTVETEVAIRVSGMIARTRLTQSFHNPGKDFVDGVYVFPLPDKGAVDHLEMRIGERVIAGEIREKAAARRAYEQARREGRKAALVEQQRPNLFTNSVAHIGPGETVRVTLEYQQPLAYERGEYRLRFPLAATPRYEPAGAQPPGGEPGARAAVFVPGASAASAPDAPALVQPAYAARADGLVNPVDIAVAIDAGVPLGAVRSSYDDAWVEKRGDDAAMVYLAKDQIEADHDFELAWTLAPGAAPQAAMFTERVGESDYALIMVVPPRPSADERLAYAQVPRETILVVDTSGSMAGASLGQAKAALAEALARLTERDRFNLVEFNSVLRPLWPMALPATPGNVRTALAWVAGLRAEGGTEMMPALSFALAGRADPGYLRQVVFMTDGAVGNEEALLRLIAERLGRSRLFTVGIGAAPNGHFMAKAAQLGRGTFTYVGDAGEVREKMGRLFAKIEAPVLQDVKIAWPDGTPLQTYPERVPDLYLDEPVRVSTAAPTLAGTVIVSGMRGTVPWSVALTPAPSHDAAGVGALWARARIAALMDDVRRGADPAQARASVVQVALAHHLVSAYTSLVAVDVTPGAGGAAKTALVASALPRGWGGEGMLAQTDTPATLQIVLGLAALAAAAVVAAVGHAAAPRRA